MKYRYVILSFLFVLALSPLHAQIGGQKSFFGLGLFGDMQLSTNKDLVKVKQGAKALGLSLMVEGQIDYIWSYRIGADVYGLLKGKGYDRKAKGYAAMKINIFNAIKGEPQNDNVYALLGAGATYSVAGNDNVGFAVQGGVGYSYWMTKQYGLFAEMMFTMFDKPSVISGALVIGGLISF